MRYKTCPQCTWIVLVWECMHSTGRILQLGAACVCTYSVYPIWNSPQCLYAHVHLQPRKPGPYYQRCWQDAKSRIAPPPESVLRMWLVQYVYIFLDAVVLKQGRVHMLQEVLMCSLWSRRVHKNIVECMRSNSNVQVIHSWPFTGSDQYAHLCCL